MNYTKSKAFTILEVMLSLVIIAGISMLLMPSLVSTTSNQSLYAALSKTHTDMQQTMQAVSMLQMKGQIAPGDITVDKFMQAVVLTHKCIDLKSDGTLIPANRKYSTYIYENSPIAKTNVQYGNTSYYINNKAGVNTTTILKNHVFISKAWDGNTIVVDVNGRKGPNITGYDIYFFVINNGVLQSARNSTVCSINTTVNTSGGCAAKYLKAGRIK